MLHVLDVLKNVPLAGSLQAHVVSDEETGCKIGTLCLLDEIAAGRVTRPDYCLIVRRATSKFATPSAVFSASR